jgi:hypothetical protein
LPELSEVSNFLVIMQLKNVSLKLNDLEYFVNISLPAVKKERWYDEGFEDVEDINMIVVWETAIQPLTDVPRLIFLAITIFVVVLAILGNILVLYVNYWR